MAISLKNLDDRLKKLEAGSSSGYTVERIAYTGPSNPNGNTGLNYIQRIPKGLSSYDFIFFKTYRTPGGQQNYQDGLCPVAVLKSGFTFALTCQPGYAATASMINETQLRVVNYNFTDLYGISRVILYYLSNIIKARILLCNISAISNLLGKFISSLRKYFQKEVLNLAISLNNHESRIAALEASKGSFGVYTITGGPSGTNPVGSSPSVYQAGVSFCTYSAPNYTLTKGLYLVDMMAGTTARGEVVDAYVSLTIKRSDGAVLFTPKTSGHGVWWNTSNVSYHTVLNLTTTTTIQVVGSWSGTYSQNGGLIRFTKLT